MTEEQILTSSNGSPIADDQHSLTVGSHGPLLLQDYHLIEKLAHFNRERIPERVVHAKGAGAHGYFELTSEVSQWTKAKFLSTVGQKTPIFVRFSTVGGERGSADSVRDPRGFAIKFYTEEGNYDIVGNNTPVFFIRDPLKFPDFVHTQKRNPQTNCKDAEAFWDFMALHPETMHQMTILFSDRGTPKSYRHMHGFGSHTFKWVNAAGEAFWVKYHFKTETGIQNNTAEEADRLAGADADQATRDLFNHIEQGGEAAWKVKVQVMPIAEGYNYRYNPFDVTKVWSHKDYPLIEIGRLVLNRNPVNYFAEVEQAAFAPSNIVPGIEFSPDKMLQGRLFAYPDAQRYRLGVNHDALPINCPFATKVNTYQRDGLMSFDGNGGNGPNYGPNSKGGPAQAPQYAQHSESVKGHIERAVTYTHAEDNDFVQAGELYRLMTADEQDRLIANIVGHISAASRPTQLRQICHFFRADADYGKRIAAGLNIDLEQEMARMMAGRPAPVAVV